jgi:hypothetical protein
VGTQLSINDIHDLYVIRNDPTVRSFMPDSNPLSYESHKKWVEKNIFEDKKNIIFIIRDNGIPIGFSLLKEINSDTIEIGVMFVGLYQRKLLPAQTAVATWVIAVKHFSPLWLVTYANNTHKLALKLNSGFGLKEVVSDKSGETCFRTSANEISSNPLIKRMMSRINMCITTI